MGGAILFSSIAVQNEVVYLLDELDIPYERYNENLVVCDSILATSALIYQVSVVIHNGMSVEDVVFKVVSFVVNSRSCLVMPDGCRSGFLQSKNTVATLPV